MLSYLMGPTYIDRINDISWVDSPGGHMLNIAHITPVAHNIPASPTNPLLILVINILAHRHRYIFYLLSSVLDLGVAT